MNAAQMELRSFAGRLVLVGAGKMGGALLEGWLRLGLEPARIAVLEPQPAPQITALGARGLRLNPDLRTLAAAEAIVIAVKPQVADEVVPALGPIALALIRREAEPGSTLTVGDGAVTALVQELPFAP